MKELIELEQKEWQALSTEGDAGSRFYESILREDAIMLLPGGMRIEGRERILKSLGARPWKTFEIENAKSVLLSGNVATLVYSVTAQREITQAYKALIGSTYVRDRLAAQSSRRRFPERLHSGVGRLDNRSSRH